MENAGECGKKQNLEYISTDRTIDENQNNHRLNVADIITFLNKRTGAAVF